MQKIFLLISVFLVTNFATADITVSHIWMVPDNSVLSSGFLEPSDNWQGRTSTMSLSVHATGTISGSSSQTLRASVFVSAIQHTGGHKHSKPPSGTFNPASGNMSLINNFPEYKFSTTYTAPENAGSFQIRAEVGGRVKTKILTVGIPGLVDLYPLSTQTYRRIGVSPTNPKHPDNVYATTEVITALKEVAREWHDYWNGLPEAERSKYDAEVGRLQINDCSLIWGGIFDYQSTWTYPHKTHRNGLDTDIRLDRSANDGGIPNVSKYVDKFRAILKAAYDAGTVVEIHNSNHWHIDW